MNQAMLSRAGPLVIRSKSSRIKATSPISVSSFTSSGRTTSTISDGPTSFGENGTLERRTDSAECRNDVRPKDDGVVVAFVEGQPSNRPRRFFQLAPRSEQRGLAGTRRSGEEASAWCPGAARSRSRRRARVTVCVLRGGGCSFVVNSAVDRADSGSVVAIRYRPHLSRNSYEARWGLRLTRSG